MKMPLLAGAYEARSIIASAQRCVNCYPEQNPSDSEFPTTHYPRSGLIKLSTAPEVGFRSIYLATDGALYAVVGETLYSIDKDDWSFATIGTLTTRSGPVSIVDNSITLVIVDGSSNGYVVDLTTKTFSVISDSAFYGSNRVDILDDFLIFNQPSTRQFYVSGALAVTFDPLDIASKNGAPDKTVGCAVSNRRIWVFGERTTEVWYNAGAADFAFQRDPGVFIPHGCVSAASIATSDTSIYWLSPQGIVFRSSDMSALRISTHAMENEIRKYAEISDAWSYTYEENGHFFYVLTFPTADKTWTFDLATGQWHERMFLDQQGQEHRDRLACVIDIDGKRIGGDWETGDLYEVSPDAFDDAGAPMLCIRTFSALSNEKKNVFLTRFFADMQVGEIPVNEEEPVARLRWSDTRGRTWGNAVSRGLGARGQFGELVQFNRLGRSRERVFELAWSANVRTALNGAYVAAEGEQ
ncbi:hypothetical protein [Caballeronia sp. LZ001]|uniref:hypothetical protein n=1 Tax=Caballeronia sp. LZ001 TaxID=3038553 RepID=UPI00285E7100|nr:hypothetical protein [Caballeronia sp. LZ001]MDR5802135.1 hypothetical protein [Caballeronia sp. LZ001]